MSSNSASTSKTVRLERGEVSRFVCEGVVLTNTAPSGFVTECTHDLTIVFGTLPWWEVPPLTSFPRSRHGLCYIPTMGWKNRMWCDGPLVRLDADGAVAALVPLGGDARLDMPLVGMSGIPLAQCRDWLEDTEGEGARISLAAALRQRYGPVNDLTLKLSHGDRREALLCVLFRMAFPDAVLVCREAVTSAPWRRLLQNLGILHGRAPLPSLTSAPIDLAACRELIPAAHEERLFKAVQRPSSVIPPRLLAGVQNVPRPSHGEGCAKDS